MTTSDLCWKYTKQEYVDLMQNTVAPLLSEIDRLAEELRLADQTSKTWVENYDALNNKACEQIKHLTAANRELEARLKPVEEVYRRIKAEAFAWEYFGGTMWQAIKQVGEK